MWNAFHQGGLVPPSANAQIVPAPAVIQLRAVLRCSQRGDALFLPVCKASSQDTWVQLQSVKPDQDSHCMILYLLPCQLQACTLLSSDTVTVNVMRQPREQDEHDKASYPKLNSNSCMQAKFCSA